MLLGFRLVLHTTADDRLILSVPLWYKLLLAGIGGLIVTAMILVPPEGQTRVFVPQNTLPLIIAGLSFLGAAYRERWIFDKVGDALTHQYGLAFLWRSRNLRISELQAVSVERFVKGRLDPGAAAPRRSLGFTPLLAMSLRAADGSLHRLESYSASQRQRLAATSRAIAAYCGIPLLGEEALGRGEP